MNRPTAPLTPCFALLAASLAVTQGLQLLRGLLAGLSVYLGQVQSIDAALLSLVIFLIFAGGFAAPQIRNLLGPRRALPTLLASLTLLRLAEQLMNGPDARLALQVAGVVVWLWLIPLLLLKPASDQQGNNAAQPVIALLLGLSIDTAIRGAFWTLDPGFLDGLPPLLATLAVAAVQLALIARLARIEAWSTDPAAAPPPASFALGPGLALHVLIFQNLAAHAALTGWSIPAVLAWTLSANLAAMAVVTLWLRQGAPTPRWIPPAAAACLLIGLIGLSGAGSWQSPALAAFGAMLGPAAVAALWSAALAARRDNSLGWVAAALGLLAIPLLLFGWYAHYAIEIGILRWILPIAAAAAVALPSWLRRSATSQDIASQPPPKSQAPEKLIQFGAPALIALLLLLPLYQFVSQPSPTSPHDNADTIRVLTYNIHQGFDAAGRPSLEAIADLIEEQQPQIVALQEVPRGWVINGSVDALSWLAQRLDMHSAWGPAADPFWGNALLSRYPIERIENRPMPNNDELRLNRAYLLATINLQGEPIQVVATHLHHIEREPQHRLPQVRALLEDVDWRRPTILLGDLNAQPHHQELRLLSGSGLVTSQQVVPTYPAQRPRQQIDHILATTHFQIEQLTTVQTLASDHLPLVALLSRTGAPRSACLSCPRGEAHAMQFRQRDQEAIARGDLTLTFRRWRRPQARVGGRYRIGGHVIEVTSVDRLDPSEISIEDAQAAGHDSAQAALEAIAQNQRKSGDPAAPLYRVAFHCLGPQADPRAILAADPDLDAEQLDALTTRLGKMDARSQQGPWTQAALESIAAHPGRRAAELAADQGQETAKFKTNVRKLKALGLTISLEVGYELSARGRTVLEALRSKPS